MQVNLHHNHGTPLDHTSYYRMLGPFLDMEKRKENGLSLQSRIVNDSPTWADVRSADAAFVHRPSSEMDLTIIRKYKAFGVPVWIDFDDDFYHVPQHSVAWEHFSKAGSIVDESLKIADVVTVATNVLSALYSPVRVGRPIHVIPNAVEDHLIFPCGVNKNKRIIWRGNQTHSRDILSVKDYLIRVAAGHKDWDWIFMGGYRPAEITEELDRLGINNHVHPWIPDVYDFLHFMKKLQGSIVIVPLEDKVFNHAKSNIAGLEATLAGAATIAPDWEEWTGKGFCTYSGTYGFGPALEAVIIASESEKTINNSVANETILKLRLSVINQAREKLLMDLLG